MPFTLALTTLDLFGSILMFAGDMLLYFTPGVYDMDGTLKPYLHIMRDIPAARVRVGGALGPVAAFLYVLGFLALPLMARGDLAWLVWLAAALLAFALICGGAYHAQYAYLSIIAKAGHEDLYEEVSANIMLLMRLATTPMYAGFILFAIAIVLGQTVFPVWFVVFTPIVTSFFRSRVDAHAAASAVHSLRRVEQPRVHDHVHCYAHLPARLITTGPILYVDRHDRLLIAYRGWMRPAAAFFRILGGKFFPIRKSQHSSPQGELQLTCNCLPRRTVVRREEFRMSTLGFLKGTHGLLLGAGVLIGSVGAKVLTSDGAKRVYVEAVAAGLRAKQACEDTVERARAEMDDIVAEAAYLNETVYSVEDEEDSASDTAAETVPAKA